MINKTKPTSNVVNTSKVNIGETWNSNISTWDTETRTWDEMASIISNQLKRGTEYLATEALDYLMTEDDNYLVTGVGLIINQQKPS
jgi:hypothetical protein